MFFKSKKVLGLDIGTSTIKIAELNVSKNGIELVSFGFSPTPLGAVNGGEIHNATSIAVAINGLINEMRSKRKSICAGLWGNSVIVKKISIPRIDPKLVADQLRWEAEQYIPFEVKDVSLAHHVINSNGAGDTMEVLLIAAQNEIIQQFQKTVGETKLELAILDVSGFALANTYEMNYGKKMGETVALLNIGAGNTNFVVVHDGEIVFSRDMPVGGANYTNEIQRELGISASEAESLKLSAVQQAEVPEEIHRVISSSNEAMTDEVRNGFEFFAASNSGLTINKCFFSGGGSAMPGLMDRVAQIANIPVQPLSCFQRITPGKNIKATYLRQINSFAAVALGLGLRKVGDR